MLKQTSNEFRTLFLLKFTEELIKNSKTKEVFELERILREKKKEEKKKKADEKKELEEIIRQKISPKKETLNYAKNTSPKNTEKKYPLIAPPKPVGKRRVLTIPDIKLPQRFQYLKPIPTDTPINLGKLNPLIADPFVKSIECDGPEENIKVITPKGMKKTGIILSKEEISQIIENFSVAARIPYQEGIFKVVVGRLVLTAIISDVVNTRFIIRKILTSFRNPVPMPRQPF